MGKKTITGNGAAFIRNLNFRKLKERKKTANLIKFRAFERRKAKRSPRKSFFNARKTIKTGETETR